MPLEDGVKPKGSTQGGELTGEGASTDRAEAPGVRLQLPAQSPLHSTQHSGAGPGHRSFFFLATTLKPSGSSDDYQDWQEIPTGFWVQNISKSL